MKNHTKMNLIQKMIISLVIVVILFTCIIPKPTYAAVEDIAGGLLKEVVQLFASLGDVVMGALNKFMLGSDRFLSAMLPQDDVNLEEDSGSWLVNGVNDQPADVVIESDYMDEKTFLLDASSYQIPNMLYSPENIFADNIAILDINFLRPNTYSSIISSGEQSDIEKAEEAAQSAAGGTLQSTIASWYKSFRNIAIVGLLSVLVYLGIRILISSTAADKAKYKESLRDWFMALCLVFVIHIIMSGILLLTDTINSLFSTSIDNGIIVQATHSDEGENANQTFKFRTNLVGLARFKAQADQWQDATAYTIIYLALIIYTCMFTFMYFKRFLWMAFFTMIAPLVALTYPLDKAGDGHAQAFNLWFKEYTMNAIIQPVHLILYSVFVSSAIELATNNPIYAIVAIAFLVPAEKFIKKMFRLDQSNTESDFGSFAGGAMAMSALNALKGLGSGNAGKQKGATNKGDNANDDKINFAKKDDADKLNSFNSGDGSGMFLPEDSQDEQQGMLDDRNVWQDMANDPNETEQNRADAQEEVDRLNQQLGDNGDDADDDNLGVQLNNGNGQEDGDDELEQWDSQIFPRLTAARNKASAFKNKAKEKAPGLIKFGIRGAKTLGKGALFAGRGLVRATGMMGGATIGLAAGLTTGDMSKAASYAATGALDGNIIGKNLNNVAGRAGRGVLNAPRNIKNSARDLRYAWDTDMHGATVARQHRMESQNKDARKQLLKRSNTEEREKAREWMGKNNYQGSEESYLNAKADLLEAGVKEELIDDVLKTEYTETGSISGSNHQAYVDAAGFISKHNYSKDTIEDEEKMARMEERVQSMVSNPNDQLAVMRLTSKMLGADKLYEQRRRAGQTRIGRPQRENNGDSGNH